MGGKEEERPNRDTSEALCKGFRFIMASISVALCVCDLLAAPAYLLLTAVVLASIVSPVLRDLSSHGKTRSGVTPTRSTSNKAQHVGCSAPPTFIHRLCRFVTTSEIFLVEKRLFLHFYIAGIFFAAALWIRGQSGTSGDHVLGLNDAPALLFVVHLCRRAYECVYVHAWGNGKMHVGGYVLGVLHYAFVPFVVIGSEWCCDDDFARNPAPSAMQMALGALLCCYGQAQQYIHHKILSDLRKGDTVSFRAQYSIPRGRWFNTVSSPHYLAEILIYVAFAIMLHPLHTKLTLCDTLFHPNSHPTSYAFGLQRYKHLILCLWVATNLTVSARSSHSWYLHRFGSKYPKNRNSIIPLIF